MNSCHTWLSLAVNWGAVVKAVVEEASYVASGPAPVMATTSLCAAVPVEGIRRKRRQISQSQGDLFNMDKSCRANTDCNWL